MSSWTQTAESSEYKDALKATESLESPSQGFVRPTQIQKTGGPASLSSAIIKQNNTIIQLLVKTNEYLEDCSQNIRQLGVNISKGKEVPSNFEETLKDLTGRLEKVSLGDPIPQKKKKSGPFYVFQDPLEILKQERKKAER